MAEKDPKVPDKKKGKLDSIQDEIAELEKYLATAQYNKATQFYFGKVKARLATLKEKQVARSKVGKSSDGYSVRKSGDGTVCLLGFPSVGKSTLLNGLTNAHSAVAAYAFTTLTVIPGVLNYKHAQIQVLDVPGIVRGAAAGTGRGKEVLGVIRSADLILILLDVHHPEHLEALHKEIYDSGIRINQRRPDVKIKKTSKDGIKIGATCKLTHLDVKTIEGILREFSIMNADVVIRNDITIDQLIDCIEDNKVYIPSITVLNKIDSVSPEKLEEMKKLLKPNLCISAKDRAHLEELKELIFTSLSFIRIYMKEPGKPADMDVPMIVFKGSTIEDICNKLHRDFVHKFKFAKVTGPSARFAGQKLGPKHVLADGDILELHLN